jgi:hypothetical protein
MSAFLPFGSLEFPLTLAGLRMWADGRLQTYSDAGATVPSAPYSGFVRATKEGSPLTGTWLASGAGTRPLRELNSFNCQNGANSQLAQPVGVLLPTNGCTIAGAFVPRNNPGGLIQGIAGGLDSAGSIFGAELYDNTNTFAVNLDGTPTLATGCNCPVGKLVYYVLRFDTTGWNLKISINGVTSTFTKAQVPAGGRTISSLVLAGIQPSQNLHGAVYQQLGYNRNLSDGERDGLFNWLGTLAMVGNFPTQLPLIMAVGDSITFGTGLSAQNNAWPFALIPTLNATQAVNVLDGGLPGQLLPAILAAFPTNIAPFYSSQRTRNIFTIGGGTNNLLASQTAATIIPLYWNLVAAAVALCGPTDRVFAQTLLPGQGIDETQRGLLNTEITTNFASHGVFGVINFAGIAGMQAADINGPNFQGDHIHPSDAGAALMTTLAAARIQTALP